MPAAGVSAYTATITSVQNSTDAVKTVSLTDKMSPDPTACYAKGTDAGDYYVSYNDVALSKNSFNCTDTNLEVVEYSYAGGKFTITRKNINDTLITVTTTDHEYDTEDFATSVVVKDGEDEIPTTNYTVGGTTHATHAGSYAVTIVTNDLKNYTGSILTSKTGCDLDWTISPKNITISNDAYTGEYNALMHTTEFNTTPFAGKSDLLKTSLTTNGTNAGTYSGVGESASQVKATTVRGNEATIIGDYNISYGTIKMEITQKALTVSLTDKVATYDAINTFSIDEIKYEGLITNPVHTASAILINNARKDAGETEVTVQSLFITDANNVDVTLNYSFDLASVKGKITVNKADFTINITGNIVSSPDVFYDGTVKTVQGYTATGDNQTFLSEAMPYVSPVSSMCITTATDAGTYNLELNDTTELTKESFSVSGDCTNLNVSFEYTPGYLKIAPKVLTVTCNVSQNVKEDKPITHDLVTEGALKELSGLVGSEKAEGTLTTASKEVGVYDTYDPTGAQIVAPYFYSNIIFDEKTGAKASNYDVQYNTVKMTIKDELVITVTGLHTDETNPVYYNGNEQYSPKGYEVSSSDPSSFNPELFKLKDEYKDCDIASGYNAGRYYMNLKPEYFVYDVTGIFYTVVVVDGYLDISPKDISTCSISCSPNEFTYNGQAQGPNITITNNGTILTKRDYTVENAQGVNAATYDITIKGTGNYTGTITKEQNNKLTYVIKQAPMKIQLTGNSEIRPYDGNEHTVSGFSATEVETSVGLLDQNKIKTKDNQEVKATGTTYGQYYMNIGSKIDGGDFFTYDDTNIIPTFVLGSDGCLSITQKDLSTIDVSVTPVEFTYDGQLKEPTVLVTDDGTLLNYNVDYVYSADSIYQATEAGSYSITIMPAPGSNYKGEQTVE